jgi:pimeloyl-ACP methyl ester carboxylesterase
LGWDAESRLELHNLLVRLPHIGGSEEDGKAFAGDWSAGDTRSGGKHALRRRPRYLWGIVLSLALLAAITLAVDRRLRAPVCAPCHADTTSELPLFKNGAGQEGLVRIKANGMEFRARVAGFGNRDGEGVILLHGVLETSIMWEPLLAGLDEAGFRVVAFDQRGYSPGARPEGVSSYQVDKIVSDVVAVANAVGFNRFHVIGHDWGGFVAWMVADRYPDRVVTVASLSTPHPEALWESLGYRNQLKRSAYIVGLWLFALPEFVSSYADSLYLRYHSWDTKIPSEIAEYGKVFREPGALRAAFNWYRAYPIAAPQLSKTAQPSLLIWGVQDKAFGRVAVEKSASYVKGPFQYYELNAGHALMSEIPEVVTAAVISHLQDWGPSNGDAKERARLAQMMGKEDSECEASIPRCLRIVVTPKGPNMRILNRCGETFRVRVRVYCPNWNPKAYTEYRFVVPPGADFAQENHKVSRGDCYYNQQLCKASSYSK